MSKGLAEAFERLYIPEPNSGCWLWVGGTRDKRGYGNWIRQGFDTRSAHRISWMMHKGPIPDGLHVLHKCDVTLCVNPEHLFLGTNQDNIDDKVRKGRHRMKTHCKYGHPLVNRPSGLKRDCRVCENAARRAKRAAMGARPLRKLNDEIVSAILVDHRTHSAIAADYGVDRSVISRIKSRVIWTHIKEKSNDERRSTPA